MPGITANASNAALNYLNEVSAQKASQIAKLASGSRIAQASDDAAGLAIGTQLKASVIVYQQDQVNVTQGKSVLQTADGGLAQIGNVLQRMMALATQAASGQVTDTQRSQDINTEYQQLSAEITTIVNGTQYASQTLLTGSFLNNVKFLVGTSASTTLSVSLSAVSVGGLRITGSVDTAATALAAIAKINSAIGLITQERAKTGAYESRFSFTSQSLQTNVLNISEAQSVIMDADVAALKSQLAATDVMSQASVAALVQAAQMPGYLLKLIQR